MTRCASSTSIRAENKQASSPAIIIAETWPPAISRRPLSYPHSLSALPGSERAFGLPMVVAFVGPHVWVGSGASSPAMTLRRACPLLPKSDAYSRVSAVSLRATRVISNEPMTVRMSAVAPSLPMFLTAGICSEGPGRDSCAAQISRGRMVPPPEHSRAGGGADGPVGPKSPCNVGCSRQGGEPYLHLYPHSSSGGPGMAFQGRGMPRQRRTRQRPRYGLNFGREPSKWDDRRRRPRSNTQRSFIKRSKDRVSLP